MALKLKDEPATHLVTKTMASRCCGAQLDTVTGKPVIFEKNVNLSDTAYNSAIHWRMNPAFRHCVKVRPVLRRNICRIGNVIRDQCGRCWWCRRDCV